MLKSYHQSLSSDRGKDRSMIKRKTPLTICFLLAAVFSTGLSYAQMTRISVAYSAISGDALPAWLAKDTGIFEKNGLDVQLVFFTGGTTASWRWFPQTRPSPNWQDLRSSIPLWQVPMLLLSLAV